VSFGRPSIPLLVVLTDRVNPYAPLVVAVIYDANIKDKIGAINV
jgi:hypothetical protein